MPADVETDVNGQRLQFCIRIAGIGQLRLEEIHQLGIFFKGHADFIIELQEVSDVIGISTFLETVIRTKFAADPFYFTEFIDVIFIRVAEPQVCADSILILVVLSGPISILLQENSRLCLEGAHPFKDILALVEQSDEHCPDLFWSGFCKSNNHTFRKVVVGGQQIQCLIQRSIQHFCKISSIHIPIVLKPLHGFPFVFFIAPLL